MDLRTLLASLCISGASEKWDDTVEKICDNGMHIADLLFKLKAVERSIHPGTDAKVIFLPAECIMSECSLMSDGDLMRHVTQRAKLFVDFFMHNKYGDTPLEEALRINAEFHILKGQSVEWSKELRSIPSNANAHTFVSGLAVTMDSCALWCASQALHGVQAKPCGSSTISLVGCSFKGQVWQFLAW